MTKYCGHASYGDNGYTDDKIVLDKEDDVAYVSWGGRWRMPTVDEIDELLDSNNCTWTWISQNGGGYKIAGKKPGYTDKSIFLPAAGCRYRDSLICAGSYGNYWSSSLDTGISREAYVLDFIMDDPIKDNNYRYYGHSVRPVCP